MYPDAPVTRQRNGDGPGRRGAEGDDSAIWRFLSGLSVWPCARRARTPRSRPSRPGGAVSPYGRMGHGVQRRRRGDGQAAGPAAVRWPAAARSAAGQIEKPTCSASLPLFPPGGRPQACPALICRTSCRIELCISGVAGSQVGRTAGHVSIVFAALPAARRANHHAGEAGPRALQGDDHDIVQFLAAGQDDDQDFCLRRRLVRCALRAKPPRSAPSGRQQLRAWRRGCWQGWRVAPGGAQAGREEQHVI